MDILLVGVCDKPQSTNTFMMNAFRKLGHNVEPWNYRTILNQYNGITQAMNDELCKHVTINDYDLVVMCKVDTLTPWTINYINQKVPVFYYFMDPVKTANFMGAPRLAKQATWASATCKDVVRLFIESGQKNSFKIMEGVDTNLYRTVDNLDPELIDYDIVFIGSKTDRRESLIKKLLQDGYNVEVFGNGWSIPANPPVYNEDLVSVINRSNIVLNFVHGNSYSDRVTLTLSAGGFLLSEFCVEIEEDFAPGIHLETFNGYNQLRQKLDYFSNSKEARDTVAKIGQRYASRFSWESICEELLRKSGFKWEE